ncbi:PTS sugar transporter subunit IIA [Mesomycoplasma neurolyticum]|uniref:Mannitol-specific phosphotransferase enzyme IIA component n=1 Tax=Mesomycoplasma neurolyticum TaxID=2120 RepID=A0A449A5C9_9BACT|nr:PTS sugar transporter subunit IIA [Mesomycoplasma neurolyticum]VEU59471.1 PTS system mannitol-specific transporter subunit IIA [Mesomycoplasma neurolyticum]
MKLTKNNIFLNQNLKNKNEIFEHIFNYFFKKGSVTKDFLISMIKRDVESSVAIGNYLFLPHANFDGKNSVLKNDIVFLHLKKTIIIDDQKIKFVVGLACYDAKHIEALQKIAIAFSNIEKIEKLVNKLFINYEDILKILN